MADHRERSVSHAPQLHATVDRAIRFNEALEKSTPLVTGKWATTLASTPDPRGFIISTKEVQGRREVSNYPCKRVHEANVRERAYQQEREIEKAEGEGRQPKVVTLTGAIFGTPKVILRDYEVKNVPDPVTGEPRHALQITVCGNSYASYREFSGAEEGQPGRRLGTIMGVAMGIVTNDGYIIVQKRGKNATYGDDNDAAPGRGIPGASAAGTLDAQLASRAAIRQRAKETGKRVTDIGILIEPLDTEYVTEGMYVEMQEEIGLKRCEITIAPTLLIEDSINPHYEIGLTGVTSVTASEVLKRRAKTQGGKTGRYEFAERIVLLTAQELGTMLTTVEAPWPGTHALTMLRTLKQAHIQQGVPPDEADKIAGAIEEEMCANFRNINVIVRHYYDEHPEALQRNKERIANITDLGYDPRVFAIDQGIAPLDEKMKEAKIGETWKKWGATEKGWRQVGT